MDHIKFCKDVSSIFNMYIQIVTEDDINHFPGLHALQSNYSAYT